MDRRPALNPRRIAALLFSLSLALGVGALGGLVTAPAIETWYAALAKPAFNPPNWLFGPVWTLLYVMMGFAAWRIFVNAHGTARRAALALYLAQLLLNLGWSFLFFGAKSPLAALIEIAALLACLAAATRSFLQLDRTAGVLMTPYLIWTCYALLLNFSIWRLNP